MTRNRAHGIQYPRIDHSSRRDLAFDHQPSLPVSRVVLRFRTQRSRVVSSRAQCPPGDTEKTNPAQPAVTTGPHPTRHRLDRFAPASVPCVGQGASCALAECRT